MGLTLSVPPGFSDLDDAVLVAGNPALGIELGKISDNAEFGMVRTEVFAGLYQHGQTVSLPVSPIDGYAYSRDELLYFWTIRTSADPVRHWISAADSLFYCAWLVDQTTGQVFSDEWYRRSGNHANVTHTNDGQLQVWTVAQRQLSHLILAASPTYASISGGSIAQDKPLTQLLAQSLNDDAKFSVLNGEFFWLGEYTNGQTVTMPTSPADGYAYSSSECKFLLAWRWTAPGASPMAAPQLADGQLGPMIGSVNSSGVVSLTIKYVDSGGNLISTNDGRVAVFAFTQRSGTPGSISPTANQFVELPLENFLPGTVLPFAEVGQIVANTEEALLTPEYFGPTTHTDGDTIGVPTSPIDGYVYARSELQYLWTWKDTTNQTGSNLRMPILTGHVNPLTGVVTLNVWRLPPGGPYVDDNNTLARISVIIVARRAAQNPQALAAPGTTPQSDFNTGGNQIVDVPTLSSIGILPAIGSINSSNTSFTFATTGTIVALFWNSNLTLDFTQSSPPSNSFSTTFVPDTNDKLYVLYYT